jgi:hypothetical protein
MARKPATGSASSFSYFTPKPETSWAPVLEARAERAREAAQAAADAPLDKMAALKTLKALFDFNANSRKVESGPYAAQSPKTQRCTQAAAKGLCNLALKRGELRCAFHAHPARFAVLGYDARQVYEDAPAVQDVQAQWAALNPS